MEFAHWRKSSYSDGGNSDESDCVEVAFANWQKSSYSDGENTDQGECVEVAFTGNVIGIRDSKAPALPPLTFQDAAWRPFLRSVVRRAPWQAG